MPLIGTVPKIAIVGPSRCGKDTAGEYLGRHTYLRYNGSLSRALLPLIAKELKVSEEQAWVEPHTKYEYWQRFCDHFRENNACALVRLALQTTDLIIGSRSKREIEDAQDNDLIDLTIWIASGVPKDPTLEFGPEVADIVIENNDELFVFQHKLKQLSKALGIWRDHTYAY